jgi:hypothetical protein
VLAVVIATVAGDPETLVSVVPNSAPVVPSSPPPPPPPSTLKESILSNIHSTTRSNRTLLTTDETKKNGRFHLCGRHCRVVAAAHIHPEPNIHPFMLLRAQVDYRP